jgi:hypothetical protein
MQTVSQPVVQQITTEIVKMYHKAVGVKLDLKTTCVHRPVTSVGWATLYGMPPQGY